jgi:hypothetical protein
VRAGGPARRPPGDDSADHAAERDHRADRQVDPPREDDEQLPERKYGDDRRLEAEVRDVALGEEER